MNEEKAPNLFWSSKYDKPISDDEAERIEENLYGLINFLINKRLSQERRSHAD